MGVIIFRIVLVVVATGFVINYDGRFEPVILTVVGIVAFGLAVMALDWLWYRLRG